jgi:CO/xanthine dehydrogenase FAD-binding subunit
MIKAYHRPKTLDEALELLRQSGLTARPLGGGTALSRGGPEPIEVIDLQDLGLDSIHASGQDLVVGAAATLQKLAEHPECPAWLSPAVRLEAPLNIRNSATIAGTLVSSDGRSSLAAVLLAVDARLSLAGGQNDSLRLGDFLPLGRQSLQSALITSVTLPLHVKVAFQHIARAATDKPLVGVAIARWPSDRTRAVVCGFGGQPVLAMDGEGHGGAVAAISNALQDSGDAWATATYRSEMGRILVERCLTEIG